MSVSDVQKALCANVGGTFYNGACRCADGSLKNIYTGDCVSEADNPVIPMSQPAISPTRRTVDEMERDDPNGSPLLFGSRDRYATTQAVREGSLAVTGGERFVSTAGGGGGANLDRVELELRYNPEPEAKPANTGTTTRRIVDTATGKAVGSSVGAVRMTDQAYAASVQASGTPEPLQSGLPLALGLGLLSFLIFRS